MSDATTAQLTALLKSYNSSSNIQLRISNPCPSPKLFTPGPVDVSKETFAAMSHTMIGHRGKDFEELYASTQPGLQEIFGTARPVFLSTSSAWGVMEGALRNLAQKKVLCLCCGAFSDKWLDVAKKCGFEAEAVQVEWGEAIDPEAVRAKLAEGGFDTVTFIHSETSTGVLNDLAGICKVVKSFPDTMLIVDTVSSLSTVPMDMDANRHRRHARRCPEGARPASGPRRVRRFRSRHGTRQGQPEPRLLFRFHRVRQERRRQQHAFHPGDLHHLRAAIHAR